MDMIAKVARAVATADWRAEIEEWAEPERWLVAADAYDLTNNNGRFRYDLIARAAIEAMREPTETMLKAGDLPGWDDSVSIGLSGEVWQAMIDAALPSPPVAEETK